MSEQEPPHPTDPAVSAAQALLATRLIAWHDEHQRMLPWRTARAGARDAYEVWVAEVMLQQTRVETVQRYYTRWMERFPTIHALAAADLGEVLILWEGLGYYARARNLHRAARTLVELYDGHIPSDPQLLLQTPGIGKYSAGAILSMAYGHAASLVDGNARRVLCRVFDVAEPVEQASTQRKLWELATALVLAAPQGEAGVLNEALMELGATLCLPRDPRCECCPIRDACLAQQRGSQSERPVRRPRKATPHFDVSAGAIWQGERLTSRLLLAQRPLDGMLGGLWEFPGGKLESDDRDLAACLQREILEELGGRIDVGSSFMVLQHAYTHFRITLHLFHARWMDGEPLALGVAQWKWVGLDELGDFPMPVTDRKVALRLQEIHTAATTAG
jgi:A/G-specific adenine glycosylase